MTDGGAGRPNSYITMWKAAEIQPHSLHRTMFVNCQCQSSLCDV